MMNAKLKNAANGEGDNDNFIKDTLITAYRHSRSAAASIPGDIPSLILHAFSRHFQETLSLGHDADATLESISESSSESLLDLITKVPTLGPNSQRLLDRARVLLTDGPRLSMNVPLAAGEDLPVCAHTLLQGTLWAVLLQAGADPDLDDREVHNEHGWRVSKTDDTVFRTIAQEDADRNRLTGPAKAMWFLCKKTRFSWAVAEREGSFQAVEEQHFNVNGTTLFRSYAGRVFSRGIPIHNKMGYPHDHLATSTSYTMVRLPPVLDLTTSPTAVFARTPRGVFVWGANEDGELGVAGEDIEYPTRVKFTGCPDVAEFEAALPPWQKADAIIRVDMGSNFTLICTPIRMLVAGAGAQYFMGGLDADFSTFQRVPFPKGFMPTSLVVNNDMALMGDGKRQLMAGYNNWAQFGLGHDSALTGFVEPPVRIDSIVYAGGDTALYASEGRLVVAGLIRSHLAPLLPAGSLGSVYLVSKTPLVLNLPWPVKRVFASPSFIVLVRADAEETAVVDSRADVFSLPLDVSLLRTQERRAADEIYTAFYFPTEAGWATVGDDIPRLTRVLALDEDDDEDVGLDAIEAFRTPTQIAPRRFIGDIVNGVEVNLTGPLQAFDSLGQ
ncbi:regulator of chromosome condensation (RCC1) repeat family protein [Carpediemonas membranifera]|uniref:Regulator of chromosome condensation (RCC1) repeat family protein n=1 Tax=Carpediemonas membranifera TaxID=201153 RepID=A0A8J6E0F6_9EUKA|nr:regulator of chromosome condensation (RCC1) repeat family protein [Carpediemonas membranifera]|eukprot:KAG9391781.1 regulator of chromosome condensation (RCC1) repeat family protein [Carpediemonas membranifera]